MQAWAVYILLSAVALGFYDISKKHAVDRNAVMPVLFLATLCGSGLFVAMTAASGNLAAMACTAREFWLILLKSCIVSASWICVYNAMQTMPISLAAPIRATSPLWTFIGSLLLYREIPSLWQAVGMITIFTGYYLFAVWGRLEGFSLRGRGMIFIMTGTFMGAVSSLYDKFLLSSLQLDRGLVQFHFSLDLVVIFGIITLLQRHHAAFQWRWTIPVTGICLIAADWLYFNAVAMPGTQISIVSLMRRSSVVVAFAIGALLFHDRNISRKSWSLLLILLGTILLSLCKR